MDGRCRSEYVGKGPAAVLAAALDEAERLERRRAVEGWEREEARAGPAQGLTRELQTCADVLARATLVVAGFYQHDRGPWRRRSEWHG